MRAGLEYSHRGRGLGASRTLPRLGCRQAGSRSRGARAGRARRAQHFKFRSGREVAREPSCGSLRAGRPAPAREGRVRGAVRGLTTWARHATQLGSRALGRGESLSDRQTASTSEEAFISLQLLDCFQYAFRAAISAPSNSLLLPNPPGIGHHFQVLGSHASNLSIHYFVWRKPLPVQEP